VGVRRRGAVLAVATVALGTGAIALAGGPPPSDGDDFVFKKGGLRYSGDGRLADAGGAEAGCGTERWRLIGGGGGVSGTANAEVSALGPIDFVDLDGVRDDGWHVTGQGAPGAVATSFAICARGERLRYRTKHATASTAELRSAKVGCGDRRFHVTTGGAAVETFESFVSSSYPYDGKDRGGRPDDGWAGSVFDVGSGGFYVFAVCVRGDVDYRRGKRATIPTSSAVARKVGCSRRSHATGGGARVTGPINRGRITSTHPYDAQDPDQAPDDGWRTSAYNLSSGTASKLVPYAICLR